MSNVFGQVASNLTATQKTASRTNLDLDDVTESRVAGIEASRLGVDQTWTAFTVGVDRSLGSTYTNATGRPIEVSVSVTGQNCQALITIGGVVASNHSINGPSGSNSIASGSAVVPIGASYTVTNGGQGTLSSWSELR